MSKQHKWLDSDVNLLIAYTENAEPRATYRESIRLFLAENDVPFSFNAVEQKIYKLKLAGKIK